jgi:5-methylcytosine-specific restriction endonuclease McrA
MRHIKFEDIQLSEEWEDSAKKVRADIEAAEPGDRKKLIEKNAKLWRDLKTTLADFSYNKCWYCETKELRSDRVVDHFRPKNRVAERKDHPGYWWLAFEWSNYRYSCTFCNSYRKSEKDKPAGGKADHFPIVDENRRAANPADSIDDEFPMLLDPVKNGDSLLVTFDDDGSAVPIYPDEKSIPHQRAKASIAFYHLDHPEIKERRYQVCREIKQLVVEGDRAMMRQDEGPAAALPANECFEGVLRRLREMIDKTAEYSRAARAALSSFRGSPWVESVLADAN